MTFRELAESQGLFVTNDLKVYFEYRESVDKLAKLMKENGIEVAIKVWDDREKTTYMVKEDKS